MLVEVSLCSATDRTPTQGGRPRFQGVEHLPQALASEISRRITSVTNDPSTYLDHGRYPAILIHIRFSLHFSFDHALTSPLPSPPNFLDATQPFPNAFLLLMPSPNVLRSNILSCNKRWPSLTSNAKRSIMIRGRRTESARELRGSSAKTWMVEAPIHHP